MAKTKSKKNKSSAKSASNRLLADNRFARHQYEILETLETGIELLGTEVKSIRAGQANLRDGFCLIRKGELKLHNVHISPHSFAGTYFNHEPLRTRKLLAHKKEINKLKGQVEKKGLTLIPLNLHLKGSWIKMTIGLGKGRNHYDKRQNEKEKQMKREIKTSNYDY